MEIEITDLLSQARIEERQKVVEWAEIRRMESIMHSILILENSKVNIMVEYNAGYDKAFLDLLTNLKNK